MDKYREAEIILAKALVAGWSNAKVEEGKVVAIDHTTFSDAIDVPNYCTDQSALDELTSIHGCEATNWKGAAWVGNGDDFFFQYESFDDHPSEEVALRYASVRAITMRIVAKNQASIS